MSHSVSWGILGTGTIAHTFTEDLLLLDNHRVTAVGSRTLGSAQAFANEYGIEHVHGSYEALAADREVDIVYVATPHSAHFSVARQCLLAGRAVLVEKPFTVTADEAARLAMLAEECDLFAMEAMWMRFNPLIDRIRDIVIGGGIGRVTSVQANLTFAAPYDPAHRYWSPDLAGGALLDIGVYPIAFGSMLLGAPDQVRAVSTSAPSGVDANTAVIARYPNGAVGLYHCGLQANSPATAAITGTSGIVTVGEPFFRPPNFTVHVNGAQPKEYSINMIGSGYSYQAEEVARCLRAGLIQSPLMPLDDTLTVMRALDSARASAAGSSGL